jgi:hypothetical protein
MSITSKVLAGTAVLTAALGISATGTLSAHAATPQCGATCIEIFSPRFGSLGNPNFIESIRRGVGREGVGTILGQASSSDPAGDLMAMAPGGGLVSDFFAAGMVSAAVNDQFGTDHAVQLEYTPLGVHTGLCSGVRRTAFAPETLSLVPCSNPGTTVWIIDSMVAPASLQGYFAIINGSTTDVTRPFAMTYRGEPPAPITIDHLQIAPDGTAPITQLWNKTRGVVG